jgi:O-antigen/teichoic acid export membrane protein
MLNHSLVETRAQPRNASEDYFGTDNLVHDLQGRSFRGGVVTVAGQSANFLLQMGATVVLARLLMPRDFGLIAMVTAVTGFIGLFKDLGLSAATIQRAKVTHAQVSFLFWVNVMLSVAVAVTVAAIAPLVAWFYSEPRLLGITEVLASNFVFSGLTVQHQALLRRKMQFTTLASIDVTSNACGLALGIAAALLGCSYWSLIAVRSGTTVINCVQVWLRCRWRPGSPKRRVGARPMLAFGRNLTAFNVLNYFTRNFDNVLIGRVLGAGPLGIYSKAYGLLLLPASQVNVPVSAVLLPGLSRLQAAPKEYFEFFINAARALALISLPIVVFSLVFARDVVLVLLGPRWIQVAPIFQLLGPAAIVAAVGSTPFWLCQSLGRTNRQLHFALIATPITLAGFIVGVRWGIGGVAASFSITFGVLYWVFVWYASRNSPVSFSAILINFVVVFAPSMAAAASALLVRRSLLAQVRPGLALMISALIFLITYISLALLSERSRFLMLAALDNCRKSLSRFLPGRLGNT